MDPSVASAPTRAATSMIQAGLGAVEHAANEAIQAREAATGELLKASLSNFKTDIDDQERMFADSLKSQTDSADPTEVQGIYTTLAGERQKQFELAKDRFNKSLEGERLSKFQKKELNLLMGEIQNEQQSNKMFWRNKAQIIKHKRVLDQDMSNSIGYVKRNITSKNPEIQEQVEFHKQRILEHDPIKGPEIIADQLSVAHLNTIQTSSMGARSLEEIKQIGKYMTDHIEEITAGQEGAAINAIKGANNSYYKNLKTVQSLAENGQLTQEFMVQMEMEGWDFAEGKSKDELLITFIK